MYEILLGETDRQEAEGVEEGQEAEPEEEERKAVPELEDLQTPEDTPNTGGPRTPEDPSASEGRKSLADIEYKMPAREEAEEQGSQENWCKKPPTEKSSGQEE